LLLDPERWGNHDWGYLKLISIAEKVVDCRFSDSRWIVNVAKSFVLGQGVAVLTLSRSIVDHKRHELFTRVPDYPVFSAKSYPRGWLIACWKVAQMQGPVLNR
jgi:hypothetical protein